MNTAIRCACRGFTLVELVTVLLIAGVLAAVAMPRMVSQGTFQADGAANQIRSTLRYAQRLAMAKGREVCVATAATSVTLTYNPTTISGAPCIPVTEPDSGAPYVLNLPSGITLTPTLAFRFDWLGRPSPNVAVNLNLSGMLAIIVAQETGYVQ